MRLFKSVLGGCAASVVLLAACAVNAAPIPWAQPSGSTSTYTYANGNTDHQLFVPAGPGNQPTATDSGLMFTPTDFKASAVGNGTFGADTVSDTVRFTLAPKAGHQLNEISVDEVGDYSILGPGAVSLGGELVVSNIATGERFFSELVPNPVALTNGITSTGSNSWTADTQIEIPAGWTNVQVVLDNILNAVASPGGVATIEKKFVGPGVTITVIAPEPSSIALLALGAGTLIRRSRRSV